MTGIVAAVEKWAVSAADLLDLWEWGLRHTSVERALALMSAIWPEHSFEELARKPIGQRNIALFHLCESLFGPELTLQTSCPQCAEPLEMQSSIAVLLEAASKGSESAFETNQTLETQGYTLHFRLPNSMDLLEASSSFTPRQMLIERCIEIIGSPDDATSQPITLPEDVEAILFAKMQSLDPLAAVSFALTCPSCANAWNAPLDIAKYLWSEIEAWAYRTLREIHWLASTYHWRETEILALGHWRRQAYLQMSGYA